MKPVRAAVIVAHPDDETLWCGGTLLSNSLWQTFIVCLCRRDDRDRADKFGKALPLLNSKGTMGNLDDGPAQTPIDGRLVSETIVQLLPPAHYGIVITHSPWGEYCRHLRHEETGRAVIELWQKGKIRADKLMLFAYEDGGGKYYPKAIKKAHRHNVLNENTWQAKYKIITSAYGFAKKSWEAETTPKTEAFWVFDSPSRALEWYRKGRQPLCFTPDVHN